MKRSFGLGALVVASVVGCGSRDPARELTGVTSSPIQAGADDTTHQFAVGVIQVNEKTGSIEVCSGALLAPNLVATARHCVASLASPQIMCGTSTFGSLVPETDLYVSIEAAIQSNFVTVSSGGIVVPTGAGQADVCGNDIALLILNQNIIIGGSTVDLSNYVVPAFDPPMGDPSYSTNVTAIGYGIDTPTDDSGMTAGVRRIKENIPLACIPNDATTPDLNCFAGPNASVAEEVLSAHEFVSGDASTCEGDSGSSAFDQGYFNKGEWVSFGVLSRGSVSADGQTCVQPIYTRFDAWSELLIATAKQAQSAAKPTYPLPSWATGATVTSIFAGSGASSGSSGSSSSSSGSSGSAGSSSGSGTTKSTTATTCACIATLGDGTACACPNDCLSNECVSADGTNFVCASPCNAGQCTGGFTCQGSGSESYCFAASTAAKTGKSGGCAAAPLDPKGPGGWRSPLLLGFALAGLRRARRRPKAATPT
jgi:hypothetical protein